MTYEVRSRYGWGWEVIGRNFQSHPIESAIAAQRLADALNTGAQFQDALRRAELTFEAGRYYTHEILHVTAPPAR